MKNYDCFNYKVIAICNKRKVESCIYNMFQVYDIIFIWNVVSFKKNIIEEMLMYKNTQKPE